MRKFKFRAWDKYNKTMWYSGEHEESINNCEFDIFFDIETHELKAVIIKEIDVGLPKMMYDEYDLPLMQYTGLKDKNGVEIYEGDIIEYKTVYEWDRKPIKRAEVVFENGMFSPAGMIMDLNRSKIIGNIYENPELLESEESE